MLKGWEKVYKGLSLTPHYSGFIMLRYKAVEIVQNTIGGSQDGGPGLRWILNWSSISTYHHIVKTVKIKINYAWVVSAVCCR